MLHTIMLKDRLRCIEFLVLICLVVGYSFATYQRNFTWNTDLSLWSDVVRKSPNKARPHNNLGDIYNCEGLIDEAIFELKKALTISPDYSHAHNNLGISYYHKKMYDEAIAQYKEALRLESDNANAYYNLGILYAEVGLYDRAIAQYKEALRLKPNDAHAHYNLGNAYYDVGLYDKAVIQFKEALNLNPDLSEPHLNLGIIYLYHLHDRAQAAFHLRETLKLDPKQPQAAKIKQFLRRDVPLFY